MSQQPQSNDKSIEDGFYLFAFSKDKGKTTNCISVNKQNNTISLTDKNNQKRTQIFKVQYNLKQLAYSIEPVVIKNYYLQLNKEGKMLTLSKKDKNNKCQFFDIKLVEKLKNTSVVSIKGEASDKLLPIGSNFICADYMAAIPDNDEEIPNNKESESSRFINLSAINEFMIWITNKLSREIMPKRSNEQCIEDGYYSLTFSKDTGKTNNCLSVDKQNNTLLLTDKYSSKPNQIFQIQWNLKQLSYTIKSVVTKHYLQLDKEGKTLTLGKIDRENQCQFFDIKLITELKHGKVISIKGIASKKLLPIGSNFIYADYMEEIPENDNKKSVYSMDNNKFNDRFINLDAINEFMIWVTKFSEEIISNTLSIPESNTDFKEEKTNTEEQKTDTTEEITES